jgi:hypothetical protein
MRKVLAVIAVAALVSVASSWASVLVVTNVLEKHDISIKGKLSPAGTAVTGADLAGNTNNISVLDLQIIGVDTNEELWIGQIVGSTTNLFLQQRANVDLTPLATKSDKFVGVFKGTAGSATNAYLLVTGSSKTTVKSSVTNETISGKIQGIWNDDVSAVVGTMKSVK